METIENVKTLLTNFLKDNNYELYSFKFSNKTLEIIVDRDEEISLDDICEISEKIGELLDQHEFTANPYYLDVSSAGAEKEIKLEKLPNYIGKYMKLHLSHPYKGENYLVGTLETINEEGIATITFKEKTRTIKAEVKISDIDKANLAIKF